MLYMLDTQCITYFIYVVHTVYTVKDTQVHVILLWQVLDHTPLIPVNSSVIYHTGLCVTHTATFSHGCGVEMGGGGGRGE